MSCNETLAETCDSGTIAQYPNYRIQRDGHGGFIWIPSDGTADPDRWDDDGVLKPIPSGKWQLALMFQSGTSTRWVYGQKVYDRVADVDKDVRAKVYPEYDPGLGVIFGAVALQQGATSLSDPEFAEITPPGR